MRVKPVRSCATLSRSRILAGVLALSAACDVVDDGSRIPPDGEGGGGEVDDGGSPDAGGDAGGGEGFDSCVAADALGNDLGVGRHCTPGGDECGEGGLRAGFCTADFLPNRPSAGCTFPCNASEECGEGATCLANEADDDQSGRSCIVTACIPPPAPGDPA